MHTIHRSDCSAEPEVPIWLHALSQLLNGAGSMHVLIIQFFAKAFHEGVEERMVGGFADPRAGFELLEVKAAAEDL